MSLKKEQSKKYMEEAELSLSVAESAFNKAKENDLDLWAHVIKNCYDAIEQAVSSTIAAKEERIPIQHPGKIKRFIDLLKPSKEVENKIYFWLGKRASAQYVDIKDDKLSVPHELFDEEDAKKAMDDCKEIISEIKELIKKIEEESKQKNNKNSG